MTYYKATRLDGTDFRTGTVDYGAALVSGEIVRHPHGCVPIRDKASTYLSISVEPTGTMIGGRWPCRLFEVDSVGIPLSNLGAHPHKRATSAMRVIREVESWKVFGPHGMEVAAIIDRASRLSEAEAATLAAARDAARGAAVDAAWVAARDAARGAAWVAARDAARGAAWNAAVDAAWVAAWNAAVDAAWVAAWDAARDAAGAYVAKDLISDEHFNALFGPWKSAIKDM